MYKKACGATAGSCTEPEVEKDPIIVKSCKDDNNVLQNIDASEFDVVKATQFGCVDRVKQLIEEGYDVNTPDGDHIYLLHWASINNRREIIKLLLEKGATPNLKGGDLQVTLH